MPDEYADRAVTTSEEGSTPHVPTSLIVTVRNDARGLTELLSALERQTEMPDEIVVVDGGSEDDTLACLERWDSRNAPLNLVVAPGANIAAGRNIAVREARYDWIICTDAGCRPVSDWLARLRRAHDKADVVAGTFAVDGESPFEVSLACAHYPALHEIDAPSLPVRISHRLFGRDFRAVHAGGRSMAFSRAAWQAVGGFPEHVYAGEDLAFSAAATESGFRSALVGEATVLWRPRGTPAETARMFTTYARGDIRTPGRSRHLRRLIAWTVGPLLAIRGGPRGRTTIALLGFAYLWLPLYRARRARLPMAEWWRIPALVALKDLSQLFGAGVGLIDAVRGVPQPVPRARARRADERISG